MKLQLANMQMRSKLTLLIFLPYAAFLFFAGHSVLTNYWELKEIQREDLRTDLASQLNRVLEAQIQEFDVTHSFLSNQGEESALAEARSHTDKTINDLKSISQKNELFSYAPELKQANDKVLARLDLFIQKRELNQTNLTNEGFNYFEELSNDIFEELGILANADLNLEISKSLFAYIALARETYEAHKEQRLLEKSSRQNLFALEDYEGFRNIFTAQEIYRKLFFLFSTEEQREIYRQIFKPQIQNDLAKIRNNLTDSKGPGKLTVDLGLWRQALAARIQGLNEVQNKILHGADIRGDVLIGEAQGALYLVTTLFLIVTLVTSFLIYWILNNITQPLQSTVALAEQVSQGNLKFGKVPFERHDEIGGLQKAIHKMGENLQEMTSRMKEEIKILSGSASEIATSITEVSSTTAETASAVTETTTTVEELKQTAQISVEKANDVVSNAEKAVATLKASEKALNTTIEDMKHIQERMNTISESIVKLSEHGQVIGEIIDTVNDLAEQSNLLAVNAAIEAAKAGDQGKGFSVVAQEVRSLAEQSKQATIQVHNILKDIQNATSSAVMATEQGTKAVTKGVSQSSQTNESIRMLSGDISKVAQTATQIVISSQQQLIGVDQVTTAMSNIKEASNQHVSHMQKIKEKVYDLNTVGQTLKTFAEQYQL